MYQVMIAEPTEKGSSIEASEVRYEDYESLEAAAAFVEQYNRYNRHNASRAYLVDEVPPKADGMAASLINTINAGIESGSEFIFIDGKGDMDSMRQAIDMAHRNGRCLDMHIIDFSNQPEHSSSINLETGTVSETI